MDNYPYIIATLPDLVLDFAEKPFDFTALSESVKQLCSDKDVRLIEWLEAGQKEENRSHYFYHSVTRIGNGFLKKYFDLDCTLRKAKVAYLEKRVSDIPSDLRASLLPLFGTSNLIEREKSIDKYMWDRISEMVPYGEFSIDTILSVLAKAAIVGRWGKLDSESGGILFKNLVNEVRGTFSGAKFDSQE
ncbi:MAG: DUF2764 family protein [Bacteroidales bacterium]|nr:DUF2764 family protein [Candidatus Cacconaster merdequi]